MRIIKNGTWKNVVVGFKCHVCACEYEADAEEINGVTRTTTRWHAHSVCPQCHSDVLTKIDDSEIYFERQRKQVLE